MHSLLSDAELRDGRDLRLDVLLDTPLDRVYRNFVEAERYARWIAPNGWKAHDVRVDARPGGEVVVAMTGPEGEQLRTRHAYAAVIAHERLVLTDAYGADFAPSRRAPFTTLVFDFSSHEGLTRIQLVARHWREEDTEVHLRSGFHPYWLEGLTRLEHHERAERAERERLAS